MVAYWYNFVIGSKSKIINYFNFRLTSIFLYSLLMEYVVDKQIAGSWHFTTELIPLQGSPWYLADAVTLQEWQCREWPANEILVKELFNRIIDWIIKRHIQTLTQRNENKNENINASCLFSRSILPDRLCYTKNQTFQLASHLYQSKLFLKLDEVEITNKIFRRTYFRQKTFAKLK